MSEPKRTPEETRELIRMMKKAIAEPCSCRLDGPEHTFKCFMGAKMLEATISGLEWSLGDDSGPPAKFREMVMKKRRGEKK